MTERPAAGRTLVHGTCLEVCGAGVLLRGAPGAGKSDLALRLLHLGRAPLLPKPFSVHLVSDDYIEAGIEAGAVIAHAPAPIAGKLEVRFIAIVPVDFKSQTRLWLVADLEPLDRASPPERLPDPTVSRAEVAGRSLPRVAIDPAWPSAPERLCAALAVALSASGESA